MPHEIKTYDFNGQPIPVRVIDGAERFTLADLVKPFGVSSKQAVEKLFKKHGAECLTATTNQWLVVGGKRRRATLLAPLDVFSLAAHLDNPVGVAFRLWVRMTFLAPYLSGARMVSHEQYQTLADRVAQLVEQYERSQALVGKALDITANAVETSARTLGLYAHRPEVREAIEARKAEEAAITPMPLFGGKTLKEIQKGDAPRAVGQ